MARVQALTPRQEQILRWIAQGSPAGVMEGEGHRISAAALRNRGLIRTSGRGPAWSAKLTAAGQAYLARLDAQSQASQPAPAAARTARYHLAVRALRDDRDRHEVSRGSLTRALRLAQRLVTEAESRGWSVRPTSESENGYGQLDWTGSKDGHLELEVYGQTLRLRIHEEGVHARGRWEEQVARFVDVGDDSPLRAEAPLPEGDYDARATGRLKLELHWGPWWTRQQTRWSDTGAVRLEDRIAEVLVEIERRALDAGRDGDGASRPTSAAGAAPGDSGARLRRTDRELAREPMLDDHLGAVLSEEAGRWEQAQRVRRYLEAMELAFGEDPDTVAWIAWGRAYADRIDPLSDRATAPRPPRESETEPESRLTSAAAREGQRAT